MMDANRMNDILDMTIRTLYNNLDQDGLHFERQILWPHKISVSPREASQLWDILLASGLADSVIGFGHEGKLEITHAGIQMMTRFGSYKNFLAAQQNAQKQLPPQLNIQLSGPGNAPAGGKQEPEAPGEKEDPKVPSTGKRKPSK